MVQVRYFHRLHVSSGKQFMVFGIENNVFSLGFDGTTVRWVILRHGCWWDSVSSSFTTRENENKGKQKQNHLHAFFLSFEVLQCVAVLSSFPSLCRRSQMEYIIQPKLLSYLFVCLCFWHNFSSGFGMCGLCWSAICIFRVLFNYLKIIIPRREECSRVDV